MGEITDERGIRHEETVIEERSWYEAGHVSYSQEQAPRTWEDMPYRRFVSPWEARGPKPELAEPSTSDHGQPQAVHPLIQMARGAITDGLSIPAERYLSQAVDAAKDLEDALAASVPADWHGLMRILDTRYPPDVFTGESWDVGARLVAALRREFGALR